jgi:hypothetical protein
VVIGQLEQVVLVDDVDVARQHAINAVQPVYKDMETAKKALRGEADRPHRRADQPSDREVA